MSGTYLSKIPVLVVALVIGIVLVTSAVVPLASDYSDTKTFKNAGLCYMSEIDSNTDLSITWDHTDPSNITIGDKKIPVPQDTRYPLTIICSNTWGLRYLVQNDQTLLTLFDTSNSTIFNASSGEDGNDLEVTISEGTATFDNGLTTAKSESFTTGYCIADTGGYVMKKYDDTAYLNGDSVIFGTGRTSGLSALSSPTVSLNIDGNIEDGVVATSLYPSAFSTSETTINYSEVGGYLDLYTFTSVQFTVSDTSDHTATATYNQVIVPSEVSADPDNPAAYKNLVKVVPLMAFIMLVVAAAGMVYFKNKD